MTESSLQTSYNNNYTVYTSDRPGETPVAYTRAQIEAIADERSHPSRRILRNNIVFGKAVLSAFFPKVYLFLSIVTAANTDEAASAIFNYGLGLLFRGPKGTRGVDSPRTAAGPSGPADAVRATTQPTAGAVGGIVQPKPIAPSVRLTPSSFSFGATSGGTGAHLVSIGPGSGSGSARLVRTPRVRGGAKPATARRGGIQSIDRVVDRATGAAQTTIEGRVLPTMPYRAGLEKQLGPTMRGADRAHLWGRVLGDEAAAGVLYAPGGFNRGVQGTMEKTLQALNREARVSGGHVWLKATNLSYGRDLLGGKWLAEAKYEFSIRLPNGRVSKTVRIEFGVDRPGTPVTPKQPGWTVTAPLE